MENFSILCGGIRQEENLLAYEAELKELYEARKLLPSPAYASLEEMYQEINPLSIKHNMGSHFPNSLSESSFILPENDVGVIRHLRWLPPIPHSHDFFEVIYILNGQAEHFILDEKQILPAGSVLIMAPGTSHAIFAEDEEAWILNFILKQGTFQNTFLQSLESSSILHSFFENILYRKNERSYLLFQSKPDPDLEAIGNALYREENQEKPYKSQVKNQLMSLFFSLLLRNHEKDLVVPALPVQNGHASSILFILQYMENHADHLSLQDICDYFNYSQRQMIRLIQQATGKTFSENLRTIKLDHAARLLSQSSMTISKVCEECGFSNPARFSRQFTEKFGCSPKEYRNKCLI